MALRSQIELLRRIASERDLKGWEGEEVKAWKRDGKLTMQKKVET